MVIKMILQKIVWQQQAVEETELFYKVRNGIQSGEKILLSAGGKVDFCTYMNIFSAEKWKEYTGIKSITLSITFEGKIKVLVYALSSVEENIVNSKIMQEEINGNVVLY